MDTELREKISSIQFACWSDEGKHTPEASLCQECNNQLVELIQQEIAKASIKEIETLFDEVTAGDPDDWNRDVEGNLEGYTEYRTAELYKTLKEHKEQ